MLGFRNYKIGISIIMTLALLLVPSASVYSQDANMERVLDSEVVVATLDNNSDITDIKVLKHLRIFGNGNISVEDTVNFRLASVRNMFGTEKINQTDNKLSLNVNVSADKGFEDIYYLAQLDKNDINEVNMPVKVKVEYFLDGQKVSPQELVGKSGDLRIVTEVENTTGQMRTLEYTDSSGNVVQHQTEVFTPYAVSLSGWQFDNNKFTNIKAPGVAGESPQGVIANVQGVTQVSWTMPLIPPKFPAKQYAVLEAKGTNIELPSFNIAVMPILPVTSEIDSLGTVKNSLSQLYDGFDTIQQGIGSADKDASLLYGYNSLLKAIGSENADGTILFGLNAVKNGMKEVSGGLGSLYTNLFKIRVGLSTPGFDMSTYDTAKGTDARGNAPGVKDAVMLMKTTVENKVMPALMVQKSTLTQIQTTIGKPGQQPVAPSSSTSIANDIDYLKSFVKGTPAEKLINESINPKLSAVNNNVGVLRDGGNMVTSSGNVQFPASVSALEGGMNTLTGSLGKANDGLGMMVLGLGMLDANGKPVEFMINGKPGSILFAMSYLQGAIDKQLVPGVEKMHKGIRDDMKPGLLAMQEGTALIGAGSGEAKDGIAQGLVTFESIGALVLAMQENAAEANTFIGKSDVAEGSVVYIYQTPAVSKQKQTMNYGLGIVAFALVLLAFIGRPPKEMGANTGHSA